MKIRPEYRLAYDEDDIGVYRKREDGTEEYVTDLSISAALAWDGIASGYSEDAIIQLVAQEYSIPAEQARADCEAFFRSLVELGFAEP